MSRPLHGGLRFLPACVLLACAVLIFGNIAEDVMTADSITLVDMRVTTWFQAHASPALTQIALVFTDLHGTLGVLALGALLSLAILRRRERYWLNVLLIAVPGSLVLNATLKLVFERSRPHLDHTVLTLFTYSFPSGHTAGATAFYGVLACYLIAHMRATGVRITIAFIALLLIGLVGVSRIYLGVHFLSDVLAAIAESAAWLVISFMLGGALFKHSETAYAEDHRHR